MTTTAVTSGQSIGTSTNVGESKFITKTTLQTGTTAFLVSVRVTNGAGGYLPMEEIVVRYTSTSWSYSANATGVAALQSTSRFVSLKPGPNASQVVVKESTLEPVTGADVFIWCEIPKFANGVAATLDINLVELP